MGRASPRASSKVLYRGRGVASRWSSAGVASQSMGSVAGDGRQRRGPVRTALSLVIGGLATLGLFVVVATATPLVSWWATALAGEWQEPDGDVLIVLGGSELGDGLIGTSSYWRSVYAVRVWRESRFRE